MEFVNFKKAVYKIASQLNYEVQCFEAAGVTPNFHVAKISLPENEIYILCSIDGNWAYSNHFNTNDCHLNFIECDPFSYLLNSYLNISPLSVDQLNLPFNKQSTIDLSNVSESDISYWSPKTLGDTLFNWWD